jgi:hypothetical protein
MLEIDSNDNPLRNILFAPPVTQGQLTLSETPGLGVADKFANLLASDIGKGETR